MSRSLANVRVELTSNTNGINGSAERRSDALSAWVPPGIQGQRRHGAHPCPDRCKGFCVLCELILHQQDVALLRRSRLAHASVSDALPYVALQHLAALSARSRRVADASHLGQKALCRQWAGRKAASFIPCRTKLTVGSNSCNYSSCMLQRTTHTERASGYNRCSW